MATTDLSKYNNSHYNTGAGFLKRTLWYFVNATIVNSFFPFSGIKVFVLKMFGARISRGVIVKPHVNVKYPWRLSIGAHSWIGENVWIDNLDNVTIGSNVCISQGALLLTGNHNFKKTTFDLITSPIIIEDGVWIGAKTILAPGTVCKSHAMIKLNSVAKGTLESYGIYAGNPAVFQSKRVID
jgi:putative colanic acid biosynthesis acetyltransferase WcaF